MSFDLDFSLPERRLLFDFDFSDVQQRLLVLKSQRKTLRFLARFSGEKDSRGQVQAKWEARKRARSLAGKLDTVPVADTPPKPRARL